MKISAIVPTIGRPASLKSLLESLAKQTHKIDEVIVSDGSIDDGTKDVIADPSWERLGLVVKHVVEHPPNAVRQRISAIKFASGDNLLFLDDDVVLEPECVKQMLDVLENHNDVVAVMADFNNQSWPEPTRIWQFYLRWFSNLEEGGWQGKIVGPLLRFGFNPVPNVPTPVDWLGMGNSLVRRSAFVSVGGFSSFFLHRCTMNEDVDLGIKLKRVGRIIFCPSARMAHHHANSGRVPILIAAEDDLFNRFFILRRTLGLSLTKSLLLIFVYFFVETLSHFLGCLRRRSFRGFGAPLSGRLRACGRLLVPLDI